MTFFFDRNMGRKLPEALRLLGFDVVWHDERGFAQTTTDEEWLAEAGSRGWIVITHDARIARNASERQALIAAGVACFVMSGGKATRWDKVREIAAAWPRMGVIIAGDSPPYIWRFHPRSGWRRL